MIHISDHAIVRYCERVLGLDVKQLKEDMISPRVEASIKALGDGRYPVGSNHQALVVGGVVVTVVKRGIGISAISNGEGQV